MFFQGVEYQHLHLINICNEEKWIFFHWWFLHRSLSFFQIQLGWHCLCTVKVMYVFEMFVLSHMHIWCAYFTMHMCICVGADLYLCVLGFICAIPTDAIYYCFPACICTHILKQSIKQHVLHSAISKKILVNWCPGQEINFCLKWCVGECKMNLIWWALWPWQVIQCWK